MDVSSASLNVAQQMLQVTLQASAQAIEQTMKQELDLIEAMAGAAPVPVLAAPPPGVGTVVDTSA